MKPNNPYELIGRLSIEFNKIEFFSAILYDSFDISEKSGFKILEKDGFNKLLIKIKDHLDKINLEDSEKNEINTLLLEIDEYRKVRNSYIHSLVYKTDDREMNIALDFLKTLKQGKRAILNITNEALEDLIKKGQTIGLKIIYTSINLDERTLNLS